jgi:hypothetical protein
MKYIFFSTVLILSFALCSTPPPPKQAFDAYVRYLDSESQVTAEARLLETSGDAVNAQAVEVEGGIAYQEEAMRLVAGGSRVYKLTEPAAYQLHHVFKWVGRDGQARDFAMEMPPMRVFGFEGGRIDLRQPATFRWEGAPLTPGETLVFMWENPAKNLTVPMEIFVAGGETRVDFPAARLAELSPGQWTLYLVRKKLTRSTLDGLPASGRLEFYTRTDTVVVE